MKTKQIWVNRNFYDYVLEYTKKQIKTNAKLDKEPNMAKTTRLLAEECIIDGNTIIFRIPNGNVLALKKRIRTL